MKNIVKKLYLIVILAFLYLPITVMIVQSFNAGRSRVQWEGFSLHWYADLFHNEAILNALWVTLLVALLAMIISTLIGTLAAIGIFSMKRRSQSFMMTMTNLPNTMPDIVTGISLMMLFLFFSVERSFFTMLIAHIAFDIPFVILSVLPLLRQVNRHTYEAALDLGATPGYALTHITIPLIQPGIVTGALLAFTLSLDDFTISYFTSSPNVQNLSTLIYSATKLGVSPVYYALSALMFVILLGLLILVNYRSSDRKQQDG